MSVLFSMNRKKDSDVPSTPISEAAAIGLYRDAGDWARHFSCVRLCMGLILVLGGAGTTLLATGQRVVQFGVVVWLLGLVGFAYFTTLVVLMQNRQKRVRAESLTPDGTFDKLSPVKDVPLLFVLVFTLGAVALLVWR